MTPLEDNDKDRDKHTTYATFSKSTRFKDIKCDILTSQLFFGQADYTRVFFGHKQSIPS